jgi:hypothetical protein
MMKLSLAALFAALQNEKVLSNKEEFVSYIGKHFPGFKLDKVSAEVLKPYAEKHQQLIQVWTAEAKEQVKRELASSHSTLFPTGRNGNLNNQAPIVRNLHIYNALNSGVGVEELLANFVAAVEPRYIAGEKQVSFAEFIEAEFFAPYFASIATEICGPRTITAPALPTAPKAEETTFATQQPPAKPAQTPAKAATSPAAAAPAATLPPAGNKKQQAPAPAPVPTPPVTPSVPELTPDDDGYDFMNLLIDRDGFFNYVCEWRWSTPDGATVEFEPAQFEDITTEMFDASVAPYLKKYDTLSKDTFFQIAGELIFASEEEEEATKEATAAA